MFWAMVIVPVILLFLGVPIFVILLASGAVAVLWVIDLPLTMVHQVMFGSLDHFTLIALPFFIFSGMLMGQGGMSKRIIAWALSIVGGVRGGLGLTTVTSFTLFGAMSGSAPATVAAIGRLVHGPLRENGYGERFTSGLIISIGGIATLIPPSISMILYGAASSQSVAHLFIAGILPGLLIAGLLALYVYIYAARHDIGRSGRFTWAGFLTSSRRGLWALGTPGIILGGIYSGVFTPTEAGGVAALYAVLITRFVYRDITWKGVWNVAIDSMYVTSQVFIIIAAAGVYSWLLTVSSVPQEIIGFLKALSDQRWVILILINIFLLVVGCFIDPASAILVLTPLLIPVVQAYNVDLIHFGVIMTVNLEIGMFTPPMGLNIFMAQALFNTPLRTIYPGLIPFFFINLFALVIVTFVPEISLYLTRFVG